MEFKYLLKKIKIAWTSESLGKRIIVYIRSQILIYFYIPLTYLTQSKNKLSLNLIDGYKDQRSMNDHVKIKSDQIVRIIKAYKLAKNDEKISPLEYKIRGLWKEWISVNFKELIIALETENLECLSKLFNNIIREQFTRGLGGYDEWNRYNCLFGKSYLKYVWINYYKKLINLQGNK